MSAAAAEAGQEPSWPVEPSGWLRLLTAPEDRAGTTRAAARPQQRVLVFAIIGLAALARRLSTRVKIQARPRGRGRIVIEYFSEEELGGLCERLGVTL